MIFYYSRSGNTKIFAELLGEVTGREVCPLESDLEKKGGAGFMFKALRLAVSRKGFPVSTMPDAVPDEIFLCSPVWAGEIAAPAKFFLENADLKNTTVNILLTASMPTEKYKTGALELLAKIPCKPGNAYIFAASKKVPPEPETIKEQLRELLNA